jgi:penicillin-binding protein 1A
MDDLQRMGIFSRRPERVEPAVRRKRAPRGELDIGVTERDRASPGRSRSGSSKRPPANKSSSRGRAGRSGGRKGTRRKGKAKRRGFFRRALRIIAIALALVVVTGGAVVAYYASKLPNITSWDVPERPPNIQILGADGTLIANRGATGGANITLEELPPYVPQAVVAIEDRRFYSHIGVDPIGLVSAVFHAATSGDRIRGASTITQQLARTLFLTMDRTAERKIQEAILAVWLEIEYSKNDILEMYLNRVYFGAGAYGIDAAARTYFGKPASQLTLAEASMIAGLLPAPSRYAPTVNMEAAKSRQQLVLDAMVEAGYVTQNEADLAYAGDVTPVDNAASGPGNYVADWVADLVPDFIGAIPGDIIVQTTIDPTLQDEATTALRDGLDENGETLNVGQGALVAMSPDGAVRAMVGGRDYATSQFNRAVNAFRQPGSAFKPFVYLTALERGLTPETIRFDQPVNIDGWTPEDYTQDYLGPVTLEHALALSLNTVSAQLTAEVGPAAVVATARRLGIGSQIEPNMSIALGTSEVSLLEMTGAYATFANGGSGVIPYVIQTIRSEDGDVLYQRTASGTGQVIQPQYIGMMNEMLSEVLRSGTGQRAVLADWPAAGKTGTSQDWRDAWFIGYTAHLVTGVWVGNDDNSPTNHASGGNLPASVWSQFMTAAHQDVPVASLPGNYAGVARPANITDIINQNGVYNEYQDRYDPAQTNQTPPPGYAGPTDRYNPNYDPRYDPNYQPAPPAPVSGPPAASGAPAGGNNPIFGGFFRRLFGGGN